MDLIVQASRRAIAAVLTLAAAGVCGATLAWACTPSAGISLSPASGSAGSQVVVDGSLFAPGPVEIRWGGSGGPILATTVGPTFAVNVTIPAAPAGARTILAVGRDGSGAVAGEAASAFTVTGGTNGSGNSGPAPASPSETTSGARSAGGGATSRTASGRDTTVSRRSAAPAPAGERAVAASSSGERVFAGSLAPRFRAANAAGAGAPAGSASERTAASDLWSGFGRSSARAGLGGGAAPAEQAAVPALTLALLGLGLLTALGGVAAAGRRRARVRARR
jgi:hypothetical protein